MSRYRKIDPRIWNDAKFMELTDNGKLVFFMLLTHPSMTALGAMRATIPGLAAELSWPLEAFREAFGEACARGMAEHDERACLIALPRFLKYNAPESPNVIKAWIGSVDLLPECGLKTVVIQRSRDFAQGMSEGFAKAFADTFGRDYAYTGAGAGAVTGAGKEQNGRADAQRDLLPGKDEPPAGKKPKGEDEPPPILPDWLPLAAWEGLMLIRKRARRPMTNRAKRLALEKLAELRDAGQDPAKVLDQSVEEGWLGIFPLKGAKPGKGKPSTATPAALRANATENEDGSVPI